MSFIATIQVRNAEITAQIAALVAERDENDAALRVLARFGFDTNSAASTQELPRPMEGAADRGEVRPGLAASNIAPVAMGEADAVDLTASADQSSSQPQAESGTAEIDPPDVVESEGGDDEVDAQTSQHVAPIDGDVTGAKAGTGKTVGPSGSAAPSLRRQIEALHKEHPEFTARQAVDALGCKKSSLTGYSSLLGIKWAPERGAKQEPVEADPSAEAPEPAPEPESPPASTPEPANDAQDNRVATAGKRFWLVNDAGLFLNRFGTGFTADRRNAWDGNEKQLAGIRRSYLIARDLREKPVTKEQPAPINREVA